MSRRSQLPSRSFSNNNLGEQAKVPETFSSDRRWVLGTRKPPIQIEKVGKFPDPAHRDEKLTMYAQSSIYSMHIYDQSHIIFKCKTKRDQNKEPQDETSKDMKSPTPVETVSPAPAGGFLLNLRNKGLIYFTYFGNQIPIVLSSDDSERWDVPISLTAFYWIMPSNSEIFSLVGSMFGHVYKLTIAFKAQNIPVLKLYEDKNKTPVASITSILYNGIRYLLVTTFRSLKVLSWADTDGKPIEVQSYDPPSGPNVCVPSFVCSNETHISWLTHDDLRVYTYAQICGDAPGFVVLEFEKLQQILDIKDAPTFLSGTVTPIIMSKYYTIIAGPNSIVGFSTDDLTVQFRYPLSSDSPLLSMYLDKQLEQIHVATQRRLYNIYLNSEVKAENVRPLKEVKAEMVKNLQTSKEVRAAEVLSSLLENNDFRGAVQMLKEHLERVTKKEAEKKASAGSNAASTISPTSQKGKGRGRGQRGGISQEKITQLCEEFFIFELMVIYASENNKPNIFTPRMLVDTEGQFDVFAALSKLLQLRAFSPVADRIKDKSIIEMSKDSPLSVRMLLEDGDIVAAVDKILGFGPQVSTESLSSIVFKYRGLLKSSNFYSRINEKPVHDFVLSILPFIAGDLPCESAFTLLRDELKSKQPKQIDILLWSLTTSAGAAKHDAEVYEDLKLKLTPSSNLLTNQFSSMQHCLQAKMYRTAAAIASSCGLHEEAILAAKKVDGNLVRHFIKRAPRPIQASLCRTAGIEMDREDGDSAIRAASKATVTKELDTMEKKLALLEQKFEESEEFLQTLQEWGNEENVVSNVCVVCQRLLNGQSGYSFPCGHSFHEECLMKATEPTLDTAGKDIFFRYRQTQSTEDRKWLEEKMTEECPLCGMNSVNSVRSRLDNDEVVWPTDLMGIMALK